MRIRDKRPELPLPVIRFVEGRPGVNGEDGKPGLDGAPGVDGRDGIDGKRGPRGLRGEPGKDGERGLRGSQGKAGARGEPGLDGWSPILAVVSDGERRVHQVVGWTGGQGAEPESGWYIGPLGPVQNIAEATNLRGPRGQDGGVAVIRGSTAAGVPTYILANAGDPSPTGPAIAYRPTGEPGQYTLEIVP